MKLPVPLAAQELIPLPNRKEPDDVVFDALGLTDWECREFIESRYGTGLARQKVCSYVTKKSLICN